MQNTAFNARAFRCPAFEPMFPLMGGVQSAYSVGFDGTNDYIVTSASTRSPAAGDLTLCGWFYLGSVSTLQALFSQLDGTGTGQSWLEITAAAKLQSQLGGSATTGSRTLVAGLWHHLAVTVSGTTLTLYVNGLADTTATRTMQAASGVNNIGASKTPGNYFNGRADDLRIYSRALTAAEVQSIYRNSSSPPTDGLVAYFPMDEGTGTTITDTVGGLVGTLTNGPTWQTQVCPRLRSGRDTTQSWGVSLVGASSHYVVSTSSPLDPSATNFTASAWVKFTGVATQQVILSQLDGAGTGATWLELTSGAKLQTAIGGSNLTGATSLVANVWYHVALQQSGTTSTLYVNGTADGTATRTPASASGVIRIGTSKAGANYMTGNVKSVRIDNAALSAADIAKLANNIPISATPVGHWKLDDGTSTTATDSSGNGNHGTLTNGPAWSGDIPQWFRPTIESSYALSCDGVNDYVEVPHASSLEPSQITISCFARLADTPMSYDPILTKSSNSSYDDGYTLYWIANSIYLTFRFGLVVAPCYNTIPSSDRNWHHICGGYNGIAPWLYVDNIVNGSISNGGSRIPSSASLLVGRVAGYSQYSAIFVDELCIYNIALPAAAVADAAAGYLVRAGLVSRWKLDNNANDAHGTNHGTEQGGVGYSTSVPGTL